MFFNFKYVHINHVPFSFLIQMKTVRTVVLFTLLLVSCSATPVNRLDNAIIRSIQSVGRVWNRSFEQGMDRFSQGLERFTEGVFTVLSDALSEVHEKNVLFNIAKLITQTFPFAGNK